jgi:hypothetical protein
MRIVGLANPDLIDPSSAPWPPPEAAKHVDANFAEANGYSPKTGGLLAREGLGGNGKGRPNGRPA